MPDNKAIRIDQEVIDTYDNEVKRLYELTDRQAALLLGQTDYIAWAKRWINLTMSHDEISQLKDNIDYQLMTPIGDSMTLKEDICEGIKCAAVDIFGAAAAAINSNIELAIGDDGEPILKPDDTQQSTELENDSYYGDCVFVYDRILEYIQDFEDYFTANPSSEATTVEWFSYKYLLTASITDAVADYYAHRGLSNPQPTPPGTGLRLEFFCEGLLKQVTAAYIIDVTPNDKNLLLSMVDALSQEQYVQWANQNDTQRKGYEGAPCYTLPDQVFEYTANAFDNKAAIDTILKITQSGTRVKRLIISGSITDDDGRIYDGAYRRSNTGLWTYEPQAIFPTVGFINPNNVPVFSPTGGYVFEYTATNTYINQLRPVEAGDTWSDLFVNPVGSLTLTLRDEGAI